MQAEKDEEPKKVQEKQKQEETVKKVSSQSYDGILKNVTGLKMELANSLDKLSDKFVEEFKKFEELQKAIAFEKGNLEELYQVSANSDSLAVMLMAQKEKKEQFENEMNAQKESFENEMTETKAAWEKEKQAHIAKVKEDADELKKKREREEEEYQYQVSNQRKKETDAYEEQKVKIEKEITEKKHAFEKEIPERETKVSLAETELNELKTKNDAFPKELDNAVELAVERTKGQMETNYKFEKELTEKQTEGELKLKDQTIETLKSKIKDLEQTIKELGQKANNAESSVKDIAIKAIESSSNVKIIDKLNVDKPE
jgi:hypothetical protein